MHLLGLISLTVGAIGAANGWPTRRKRPWSWLVSIALQGPLCALDILGGQATIGFLILTPPALWNGIRGWREWRQA